MKIEDYTISLFDFPRDRVISDSPVPRDNFYILLNDGYLDLSGKQALIHRRAVGAVRIPQPLAIDYQQLG